MRKLNPSLRNKISFTALIMHLINVRLIIFLQRTVFFTVALKFDLLVSNLKYKKYNLDT